MLIQFWHGYNEPLAQKIKDAALDFSVTNVTNSSGHKALEFNGTLSELHELIPDVPMMLLPNVDGVFVTQFRNFGQR